MSKHARYSPSGAHGWMRCSGWESNPHSSPAADYGTAGHTLGERALKTGKNAADFIGQSISVGSTPFMVDENMAHAVQKYVEYVRALPGDLLVEERLPLSHITGEAGAHGTSDAVRLTKEGVVVVVDLKLGANPNNRISAVDNEQLSIYGLAAYDQYKFLGDFKRVDMIIVQPRLDHVSKWTMSIKELEAFRLKVKPATSINPGPTQCKWCRKKSICPELAQSLMDAVAGSFVDLNANLQPQLEDANQKITQAAAERLAACQTVVELVEGWCKAVRDRVEGELLAGRSIPGFKLVEGRRGNRRWTDSTIAAEALLALKVSPQQVFETTLISPAAAEKLVSSALITTENWRQLQMLLTQPKGSPCVVPTADRRPAMNLAAVINEFTNLEDMPV